MRIFVASIINFFLNEGFVKKQFGLGHYGGKSYVTPLYLLKIVFPKFDPLTVTGMALCVDLGSKCQNLFCLV
jgi:hypothetical protein